MNTSKGYDSIFGELPDLLDLRIADIPHLGSDTLKLTGSLYGRIVWYLGILYDSYIDAGLFRAGYLDIKRIEDIIHDDIIHDDASDFSIFDVDEDVVLEEFSLERAEVSAPDIGDWFNENKIYSLFFKRPKSDEELQNQHTFEFMAVGLYPLEKYLYTASGQFLMFDVREQVHFKDTSVPLIKSDFKQTCESLLGIKETDLYKFLNTIGAGCEKRGDCQIRITRAIVVYPLFLKSTDSQRMDSMKREAESMGIGLVVSIQDLLANFLGIDLRSLNDDWRKHVDYVTETLEREYRFLKFRKYPSLYREAKREIEEAKAESSMSEVTRKRRIEIVREIGRGTEMLLKAIHLLESDEEADKLTFDGFLTKNVEKINSRFGEDIFQDLKDIRDCRNKVSHSETDIQIQMPELIKIVNKAVQFLQFFRLFYVEKYTDLD